MKKAIFKGFAVAALALAVLFTGCKNESSNIETIKADAVEITATAYPGYNYVCWTPSEKYPTANITVVRDDGTVFQSATAGAGKKVDYDIKDGVTYKYTAYVDTTGITVDFQYKYTSTASANIGDLDETTAYLKQGNSSSASCKAINPICIKDGKLMTALDLCEYEEGCDEDYIINADNIVFEYDAYNNQYDVAFPTKEYLSYTPKLYKGNAIDLFGLTSSTTSETSFGTQKKNGVSSSGVATDPYTGDATAKENFYTNNTAARYNGVVTSAGEYTVVVEVSAKNVQYSTSRITAAKKIVFDALDTDAHTSNVKAGYIDEGKTIRLLWKPAVKADKTTKWAADSYKVYVKDSYNVYKEIAPAKVAQVDEEGEEVKDEDGNVIMNTTLPIAKGLQANEDVYYIDYKVDNNLVGYNFYVVLTDNGKFETGSYNTSVVAYAEIGVATDVDSSSGASFNNIDNNDVYDDAVLTLNIAANNGATVDTRATVTAKYKVVPKSANGTWAGYEYTANNTQTGSIKDLWLDTDYTDIALTPSADYTRFDAILKNQAIDSKVVFLYKVSQPNKKDKYGYKVTTSAASIASIAVTGEYSIVPVARTATTEDQKVKVTLTPSDTARANYTYEVYYAKKSLDTSNTATNVSYENITGWTSAGAVAFTYKDNVWKFETEVPLTLGTPVYGTARDDAGNLKVIGYTDSYVFKLVKTNKNVAATATGNAATFYTTQTTETIPATLTYSKTVAAN